MNRIKFLRNELNMTQQDLADKLNSSKSIIGLYESETRKPSMEILVRLSEIFGCSIDYILCKTDIRNSVINVARIPVLGTVKAGYDWLAEENIVDYITLKENISNVNEYYALRITRSIYVASSI